MSDPKFKFALREDLVGSNISFLPMCGTNMSTGWDVKAAFEGGKNLTLRAGEYVKIPLGFRVLCPDGWWMELRPRSSSFAKKYLHCLYGVIDCDYEGMCCLAAKYSPPHGFDSLEIKFGEAIGQIIPVKRKVMEVEEISNEDYDAACAARAGTRGAGAFGSTGL